jgi:hypothetical protein
MKIGRTKRHFLKQKGTKEGGAHLWNSEQNVIGEPAIRSGCKSVDLTRICIVFGIIPEGLEPTALQIFWVE